MIVKRWPLVTGETSCSVSAVNATNNPVSTSETIRVLLVGEVEPAAAVAIRLWFSREVIQKDDD